MPQAQGQVTVPAPVPVLAQTQDALRKDHHTLREEAPDRNDAVWFFFQRDFFLGLLALLPA